jgi:hypothetical protein
MHARRPPSLLQILSFLLLALALVLGCRATDFASRVADGVRQRVSHLTARATKPAATLTPTSLAAALAETETETPTDTPEPSPTETPLPTDTLEPTVVPTPLPTRPPAPPTRRPPPTMTFTPAPPPAPTRCPDEYCVVKATCIPGHDTRAIGHVYDNGVPVNGVRVRVSNSDGGAAVAADFISGRDPVNPSIFDPNNPGYYQIGIMEGAPNAGNWWVFLIGDNGAVISEGGFFNTQDVQTPNSCQIGITDFSK